MNSKPKASISMDLDNQWAYMKVHGDAGWEDYPSYFEKFIPHCLNTLKNMDLNITFFIVGRDPDDNRNIDGLKEIVDQDHEIANHSYNHEARFNIYSEEEILKELIDTETAIQKFSDQKLIGFRGPGFSRSKKVIKILKERNYKYDASILPTWIGPLARIYYFRNSSLSKEEIDDRSGLFGSFKDGFEGIKPFNWELHDGETFLEIPVSTIPIIKLPFHFSYLHYAANISISLMKVYLKMAIKLCKITGTEPSFLLHPLDLIGGDLIPELKFFPGMNLSTSYKNEIFEYVMNAFKKEFDLINMNQHYEIIKSKWEIAKRNI